MRNFEHKLGRCLGLFFGHPPPHTPCVRAYWMLIEIIIIARRCHYPFPSSDNNVALSTSSQPARRLQAARLLLAASRAEDAAESKAPEVVDQVAESTPVYDDGTLVASPAIWVAGGADHAETKSEIVTHQMISRADSDHSTSSSTVRRTALI